MAGFVFVVLERAGANLRGHDRNRHPVVSTRGSNRTRRNKNARYRARVTEAKFHDPGSAYFHRWNFNLAAL